MKLVKASLVVFVLGACGGGGGGGGDDCVANLVAGDLVITEVMANPDGADEGNEYWEIFNPGSSPIDLTGVALFTSRPDGTDEDSHTMRAATIGPGQYFVVGGVLDEFKPGHVDYGYANTLGSLRNGGGKLGLRCRGTLVDEIEYAEAADGIAQELDGSQAPDAVRNDEAANFCAATNEFLPDNFGTPQEANGFCNIIAPGVCNDGGTERDTVAPEVGDVVITELMPNPDASEDATGEWFEVVALADFDLNGLNYGRDGGPQGQVESPDCIPLSAGDHVLIAKSLEPTENGGLPAPDGLFSFSLINSNGTMFIGHGETVLDTITWTSSSAGVAINLGVRNQDPTANDDEAAFCPAVVAYGDGDLGTPRATNGFCVAANECVDSGTGEPRATDPPQAGELTITEWLSNPAGVGTDGDFEWVEVRFEAARDLNGVQIGSDMGTVESTVDAPDCIEIAAGGYAVFARNTDNAANGGLNAQAETGFALVNTGDRIFVGFNDVEIDSVDAPSGTDGAATQIDDNGVLCDAVNEYDAVSGNLGTPGADNDPDCNAL
jgi:hypothetical protein